MTTRANTPSSGACSINQCTNGGTCQVVPGGGYRCICQAGYTGPTCNIPFGISNKTFSSISDSHLFEGTATRATTSSSNICNVNLCANGGTCQLVPGGGYRCICPSGYFGFYCTVIILSFSHLTNLYLFVAQIPTSG